MAFREATKDEIITAIRVCRERKELPTSDPQYMMIIQRMLRNGFHCQARAEAIEPLYQQLGK